MAHLIYEPDTGTVIGADNVLLVDLAELRKLVSPDADVLLSEEDPTAQSAAESIGVSLIDLLTNDPAPTPDKVSTMTTSQNNDAADSGRLTIDQSDPAHLYAVADFIENTGMEALKLAKRPFETLVKTLTKMAELAQMELEVVELRTMVLQAAEVAYDNADPDQLSNPSASWDDLDTQDKRSWCASIMASLKAIGAISVNDEQGDIILSGISSQAASSQTETREPEAEAEDETEAAEQAQQAETESDATEEAEDSESESDAAEQGPAQEPTMEAEAVTDFLEEEASDTRAAVLEHAQPEAAPVRAQAPQEPETPEVPEQIRAQAEAAQATFGSLGMPPSPVNPPYPDN